MPRRPTNTFGREDWFRNFISTWRTATSAQRRYSISGLGGVGKSHVGRELIERIRDDGYSARHTIWLRATDEATLHEDIYTAALALRSELLLFSNFGNTDEHGGQAFNHSAMPSNRLGSLLQPWFKSLREDQSKILVVLDDLDGLSFQKRETLADSFHGDAVDFLYTTRDPLMSTTDFVWEATNFDVPALDAADVKDLLDHSHRHQQAEADTPNFDQLDQRTGFLPSVAINLGHFLTYVKTI